MSDLFMHRNEGNDKRSKKGGGDAPLPGNSPEQSNGSLVGLTLKQYADAKRLPYDFLRGLGLSDIFMGQPAVRMPYLGIDGAVQAVRFRLELCKTDQGDNRFRWKSGAKPCLYGLWRIQMAREAGYAVIGEGESDCQTLWFHEIPALGVPGANNWREERDAGVLDDIPLIYVIIEPDHGGEAVCNWLADSRIRDRTRLVRLGEHKDPSALFLADPDHFREHWHAALKQSVPFSDMVRAERDQEMEVAYETAKELLNDPRLLDHVGAFLRVRGYAGTLDPPKLAYIAMTSRLLDRPLNLAFVAQSASGKNRAVDAARELMPEEATYLEKAGSARALIYAGESFEHRTVIVAEADSIPDDGAVASAVRSLAEDNFMAYDIVEKNPITNRFETRHIIKPGPTGLITTSTRSLSKQLGTRVLEVPLSDSPVQTREIMRAHARSVLPASGSVPNATRFLALQRWLTLSGYRQVIIPFAEALADLVPANQVRMRRDFKQLLTCIQAIALLHQRQRPHTDDRQIEATIADYAIARKLLAPIFDSVATEGVTPTIRETVEAVPPDEEITSAQLAAKLKLSRSTTSNRVGQAIKGGWLANNETRKGHSARLVRGTPLPEEASALPDPELLREVFERSSNSREETSPPPPTVGITEIEENGQGEDEREVVYV